MIDLSKYETAFLLNMKRYKKIEKILRQRTLGGKDNE